LSVDQNDRIDHELRGRAPEVGAAPLSGNEPPELVATLSEIMNSSTELIAVRSLLPADSPRANGESAEHIRRLVESPTELPAIIVHRPTMRVIDGMHRLHAASLRGLEFIWARFFAGNAEDAFLLAVRINVRHGLPLSLSDRRLAATRIVAAHPQWSDRAIASVSGLAPRTVGVIRRRSTVHIDQPNTRIGRDGRERPVDAEARREVARKLIADNPNASLRDIARSARIAPSTVREVRRRMAGDLDLVPEPRSSVQSGQSDQVEQTGQGVARVGVQSVSTAATPAPLRALMGDPSLRFSDVGRLLIRSLATGPSAGQEWERIIENIPAHCVEVVAELARERGDTWISFADRLEKSATAQS
jgi:hypothetical protein